MSRSWARLAAVICGGVLSVLLALPAFADSSVRIVRLSSVEGSVQVDRNTGQGFEKAFLNMPITQGNSVRTGSDGRAEVEFEDGSAIRLTPNSIMAFPELSLRDSGTKYSVAGLQQGTVYGDFKGDKNAEFVVNFGRESVPVTKAAHVRIDMADAEAELAVFKGSVTVEGPSGRVDVDKKHEVTFDLADNDRYTLAKNFEEDPYDTWDKQQEQYHDQYMASNYSTYSPYAYGTSDLNYYGNFFYVPGYGTVWQPYFTGSGWDPFMNGAWLWYPGYGYNWVSAYPWGWTPYHYGSWIFAPGYGYVWQPGGSWAGWYTNPRVVNAPPRYNPPHPPATAGQSAIVVNRGTFVPPTPGRPLSNKVVVRHDSAGLGIPRGSVRDLGKLNTKVNTEGAATVKFHPPAPAAVTSSFPRIAPAETATGRPSAPATPSPRSAPTATPRPAPAPRMSMPRPHVSTPHAAPSPHR
jgi:hypothetical protein